jgi:hypothetical protein
MKTIILVLLLVLGFQAFAYDDEHDPFGGAKAQAEMERIHEHHAQQAEQLQSRVTALLSQKLGGSIGYRKFDGTYMVCRQSPINSCALEDPGYNCQNGCSGGDPLYVCSVQSRSLRSGMPAAHSVYCGSHAAKWNYRVVLSESEIGLIY